MIINKEDWHIGTEPFGNFHEGRPQMYGSEDCVNIHGSYAVLENRYEPNYVNGYFPSTAYGIMVYKKLLGPGKYSVEAKLPKGEDIWCAPLWFHGEDNETYFEIDVCEAYTNSKGNYRKLFSKPRLETNIWYGGKNYKKRMKMGAKKHLGIFSKDPSTTFNKFEVEITEEKITISYNDEVVREITDKLVLAYAKGKKFNLTIGTGVSEPMSRASHTNSMIVRNIKIEEY